MHEKTMSFLSGLKIYTVSIKEYQTMADVFAQKKPF